jgi:acetolactate synthase small subunit
MRTLVLIFCFLFLAIELSFPVGAVTSPPVDEVEMMLANIQKNLAMASEVTQMAQKTSAKLVDAKVEEKAELKEAVVAAETQVQAMEQVNEMYAAKMIANGIDTTVVEVKMTGPAYDAYLNYVEEGGKEEFDYFRMYLWQQK